MKNIFRIARWEFISRFKSRSFLFATFVLPVLFSLLITLPVFLLNYQDEVSTKLVGMVNLSTEMDTNKLQKILNGNFKLSNGSPEYVIFPVSVDNSPDYRQARAEYEEVALRKDSISTAYNEVKDLRASYYQRSNIRNKEYLLQKTYEKMIDLRERKDLVEIEFENYQLRLDSVYAIEARRSADSLLVGKVLNAYLVIPEGLFVGEIVEYHSLTPGDLLETERMGSVLSEVIIQARLSEANVTDEQIIEWLKPVEIRRYQLRESGPREWDFYIEFYGSVIGVVLLFMAIFTSGGFLFSSVLQEKTNRVIEILLSYSSSRQIMAGKIFGLGFLGLIQVLTWMGIAALFVMLNWFEAGEIPYLNMNNALYFLLYFSLGYFLYASIFVAIGAIFSSEQEAQQVNLILRSFAILPVLLVFFFLQEPNSEIITVLSYIPLLTPYFMILKISQNLHTLNEIYITSGLLVISVVGMVFVAAKIFRMGILLYGKKMTWQEVFSLLRSS
jgi:ABC-2 type transport system permease protein